MSLITYIKIIEIGEVALNIKFFNKMENNDFLTLSCYE